MSDTEANPVEQAGHSKEELYRQWLGLHSPSPSYYGLLGVPELESDEAAIQHAGRHIKRKLRAYQIGTYRRQALDLLTEVGQAVAVLTNPAKKNAYDLELFVQWKKAIAEFYMLYCEDTPRDPPVLEAWLAACRARGVPVTQMLPMIVHSLGRRLSEWPPHGTHSVALPVDLWLYRDAVVLAQCMTTVPLDQRAEAVKRIQKMLGVTEGLARVVAAEVTRGHHLFAKRRMVQCARRDPVGLLVRLGQRVRRYGGHLGRKGKVVVAMAMLLGMKRSQLDQAMDQLAAARGKSAKRGAGAGGGAIRRRAMDVHYRLQDLAAEKPVGLVIGAALLGVAVVALAILIASNGWSPWRGEPPAGGDSARYSGSASSAGAIPPPSPEELKMLEKYIRENPVTHPTPAQPPAVPYDSESEAAGKVQPTRSAATTFFNQPALPRGPGKGNSSPP
jgi:hypothetical protein